MNALEDFSERSHGDQNFVYTLAAATMAVAGFILFQRLRSASLEGRYTGA
jgi:hypothetical protein